MREKVQGGEFDTGKHVKLGVRSVI